MSRFYADTAALDPEARGRYLEEPPEGAPSIDDAHEVRATSACSFPQARTVTVQQYRTVQYSHHLRISCRSHRAVPSNRRGSVFFLLVLGICMSAAWDLVHCHRGNHALGEIAVYTRNQR